jgi:hypothetical protein
LAPGEPIKIAHATAPPVPTAPPATTPAEQVAAACPPAPKGGPAAKISNLDQRGSIFILICTYPASGDQWWVTQNSTYGGGGGWLNPSGQPLPVIAKNAVDMESLSTSTPGSAHAVSFAYGRIGADVASVTLTTSAGEKFTAKAQNGWWTLFWIPRDKSTGDATHVTLTWTTTDGTTYTAAGDKVSGTNGLKVPAGTASTVAATN